MVVMCKTNDDDELSLMVLSNMIDDYHVFRNIPPLNMS
jgi:uncharacterized protein YejL (UPF0352 family)